MNEIVTYSIAENQLYQDVKTIIENARANAIRSVDYNRVLMYWNTGRRVFEEEQRGADRAMEVVSLNANSTSACSFTRPTQK